MFSRSEFSRHPILKTSCMEKPSSLMQIPSKTTKETHGHMGKSFFLNFFINDTLEFCSYKALGFPVHYSKNPRIVIRGLPRCLKGGLN